METEHGFGGCRGPEKSFHGYRVSLWNDKNVWIEIEAVVAQHREFTEGL